MNNNLDLLNPRDNRLSSLPDGLAGLRQLEKLD